MFRLLTTVPLACVVVVGCASGRPLGGSALWSDGDWRPFAPAAAPRSIPKPEHPSSPIAVASGAREKTLERARALVGKTHIVIAGKPYPDDCAGLIRGLFDKLGLDVLQEAQPEDNAV